MAKMRTAGPKLKEIQERYKDDRAKLGTEMMALYKKEGINPAGGCFPLLLQMPVFIAFFFCLRESVELRHESFFFWIQDLSAPDPFFILPVVFAGSYVFNPTAQPSAAGDGSNPSSNHEVYARDDSGYFHNYACGSCFILCGKQRHISCSTKSHV
jgi:YidC/Oxa1 family membrane protein insertase